MPKRHTTITTLLMGAAAGAMLFCAPIASAEPPPCAPDDQQCQDQQKQQQGAGIANQVVDNVQQGVDQAQQATDALNPKSEGGPGIMVNVNGVPYCMPLYNPRLPLGAVVTSPTGNGVTSYC